MPRADAPHALALPALAPREQLQLDGLPAAPARTALALLGPQRLPAAAPAATLQLPDLMPGQHAASRSGCVTQLLATRLWCTTSAVAYANFLLQYHISLVPPAARMNVLCGPAHTSGLIVPYLIRSKAGECAGGDPTAVEQPAAEAVAERAEAPEGEHGSEVGPSGRGLIEGLTHRILAYLYRERRRGGLHSDALRRFYYYFEKYARLAIWKARTCCSCCHFEERWCVLGCLFSMALTVSDGNRATNITSP